MLQQTPVERVREPWARWLERWPTPAALAAAPSGEAVRAWGRLGYPRRALRLHGAAVAVTERFGGRVPDDLEDLRSLPGVGSYTAAAVASFAYGRRAVVLDTNVRRVIGRVWAGQAYPGDGPDARRDRPRRVVAARRPGRAPPAGPSRRWSWAPSSAPPAARAATRARSSTPVRLAPGRLPGLDGSAAPRADVRGDRPAVPGRPAGRPAQQRRPRSPPPSSTPRGPSRCSGSAPSPRSWRTAWSCGSARPTDPGRPALGAAGLTHPGPGAATSVV